MNTLVSFKPVLLATRGGGENGRLVFAGDRLVAILVQDADRGREPGASGRSWFVEAGFGPCAEPPVEGFATLQDVSVWINHLLGWGEPISVSRARYPLS